MKPFPILIALLAVAAEQSAHAQSDVAQSADAMTRDTPIAGSSQAAGDEPGPPTNAHSGPAAEINVLWPFFPGGLSDFKFLFPAVANGEVVLGLHSDFGWRNARTKDAGKVALLAVKVGYRQFIIDGLHLDGTVNMGWRQERGNPYDGSTLNGFIGRLWALAGYQYDLSGTWYINARGGLGVHLWRTDKFGDKERRLIPAGDVNIGVRF